VNIVGQGGKITSPTHLPGGAANAALMLVTVGFVASARRKPCGRASGAWRSAVSPNRRRLPPWQCSAPHLASYLTGVVTAMDGATSPMMI
jgi:hypothetical protein